MDQNPKEETPKTNRSTTPSVISNNSSSHASTPSILKKRRKPPVNCAQCHLLMLKSSRPPSEISSQRSRSNTPEHTWFGSIAGSSTIGSQHCCNHNHNHQSSPVPGYIPSWVFLRRDRQTGRILNNPIIDPNDDFHSDISYSQHSVSFDLPNNNLKPASTSKQNSTPNSTKSSINHKTNLDNDLGTVESEVMEDNAFSNNSSVHQSLAPQCTNHLQQLIDNKMFNMKAIVLFYLIECSLLAVFWFNRVQPNQFIDEQFHYAQTKTYCHGNFTQWDNKITTPPGLYLISYLFLKPFDFIKNNLLSLAILPDCQSEEGGLHWLRFINIVFACGNLWLFLKLFQIQDSHNVWKLSAISLVHLPPMFMFNFLFYTDVGSVFVLMVAYYWHVTGRHWPSAMAAFASLWFRQTNIVWIFMLAAFEAVNIFAESYLKYYEYRKREFSFGLIRLRFRLDQYRLSSPYYLTCFLLDFIRQTLKQNLGYLLNGAAFLLFLYLNQGIVLGDRSAHQAVLHLAQIPYFLTFVLMFGWPLIITKHNVRRTIKQLMDNPSWFLLQIILLSNCLSAKFTYQHPYLLADNRHLVFYLWKRFWYRPEPFSGWFRYLPLPLYVFTLTSMWNMVSFDSMDPIKSLVANTAHKRFIHHHSQTIKKIIFFLMVAMVIVPQQLIEFRYFLVPYILWRLNLDHNPQDSNEQEESDKYQKQEIKQCSTKMSSPIWLELLWTLMVNLITFAIFHYKTFQYGQYRLIQRIIW